MGVNTKSFDNASDMITFSRASGGYGFTKVSYGSELVTNGDFSDGSTGWTASSATLSVVSGRLQVVATSAYGGFNQIIPVNPNTFVEYSFDIAAGSGQILAQVYDESYGTLLHNYSITAGTSQTTTVSFSTQSFSSIRILIRSVTASTFTVGSLSMREVTYNSSAADATLKLIYHPNDVPRIEYDLDGSAKGLLIEEARTNLLLNNSNLYSARNSVLRGFRVSTASVVPASTQLVVSFYLKPKSVSRKEISVDTDAYTFPAIPTTGLPQGVWTRVETEVVTGTGGVQSFLDLQQLTATAPTYTQNSGIAPDGTLTATEITDGTYTYEIWGAQLEEGSFATSFIKNEGAASTRAADVASIPVTDFGYNRSEGTVLMEFQTVGGAASTERHFMLSGDNTNARWAYHNSANVFKPYDGSSAPPFTSTYYDNVFYRFAIATDQSTFAGAVNGSASFSQATTGNLASLTTAFNIGMSQSDSDQINGHIKSIKYYPRRLTDAQLQELTL